MTNQTTEILELAKKCGVVKSPFPQDYPYQFSEAELLAFASALRSQDVARVAMLTEIINLMHKCFKDVPSMEDTGFDTPPEPASQWDYEALLILGEAERSLSAAQPSAAAYVAEVEARALEEAARHIERFGKHVGWHHAAKDWPTDARQAIEIFSEHESAELMRMAAEKRKQAEEGEGGK